MKVRYLKHNERDKVPRCPNCVNDPHSGYDGWDIRIIRDGGKPDFVICSKCGNLIKKLSNLEKLQIDK